MENLVSYLNTKIGSKKVSVFTKKLGGETRYVCMFDGKVNVRFTEDEMISFLDGMIVMESYLKSI